jgi:hypothetical protein
VALARLNSLGLEVNTYWYFAATILQFFGVDASDSEILKAAKTGGDESFDSLAEARLQFVQGPLVAWEIISAFRRAHDLHTLDAPNPSWLLQFRYGL